MTIAEIVGVFLLASPAVQLLGGTGFMALADGCDANERADGTGSLGISEQSCSEWSASGVDDFQAKVVFATAPLYFVVFVNKPRFNGFFVICLVSQNTFSCVPLGLSTYTIFMPIQCILYIFKNNTNNLTAFIN